MELLSIGDGIENGSYRLCARFRSALIFARQRQEGHLACVVDESKGAGPVNIVVRDLPEFEDSCVSGFGPSAASDRASAGGAAHAPAASALEILPDRVILGGFPLNKPHRFDSRLRVAGLEPAEQGGTAPSRKAQTQRLVPLCGIAALSEKLRAFESALCLFAPSKSLVFLLDGGGEPASFSAFERELAARMHAGTARLLDGDLAGGAAAISGLGFGLTPSGDDFLAGFLLGLYALELAGFAGFSDERAEIHRTAQTANVFSRALLQCAAEGRCFEHAKNLIETLFSGNSAVEPVIARYTQRLAAVGASSGADLAVGLLLALKRETKQDPPVPLSGPGALSDGVTA